MILLKDKFEKMGQDELKELISKYSLNIKQGAKNKI
jgi:hypothetical protein